MGKNEIEKITAKMLNRYRKRKSAGKIKAGKNNVSEGKTGNYGKR